VSIVVRDVVCRRPGEWGSRIGQHVLRSDDTREFCWHCDGRDLPEARVCVPWWWLLLYCLGMMKLTETLPSLTEPLPNPAATAAAPATERKLVEVLGEEDEAAKETLVE
jgi:hypothetical protein